MTTQIDFYYSLQSPWTFMAWPRIEALEHAANVDIAPYLVDLPTLFSQTGGQPLAKRGKQRQDYRMAELKRWSRRLGINVTLTPAHFPVDESLAACCALVMRDDGGPVLPFSHACLRAVWQEERDLADAGTVRALLQQVNADADAVLERARAETVATRRLAETQRAIDAGVFGVPSFVIDGEVFWGQDRLDFVEEAVALGA
ncbi:MAG: 2-hydroxychromene-2-carboxylate isomerase [Geminicoccaceae bacterium]